MNKLNGLIAAIGLSVGIGAGMSVARAEITVGVDISQTGPAAAIGAQSSNAIALWPKTLGGQPAKYIIMDDGTDVTQAVKNFRKMTSENKVDAIVGPNITPAALAGLDVLQETGTPMIALAASASIVQPANDPKRRWAFKLPQNDALMAGAIVEDMRRRNIKTVGFIGFADSYGEGWAKEFAAAAAGNPKIVATESFQRSDQSVGGQVLKLISAKPEAILIAGSGTPAALPQKTLVQRGYKGLIYQTHGIGTLEFLKLGGKDVEGTLFPTGPGVVSRELPDSNPVKKVALAFTDQYEAKYGPNTMTQFAGDAMGAWMLLDAAVARALKSGKAPGTPEFRAALRDEIEKTRNLTVPNGVLNISDSEHQGFDERARVMAVIKDGKFSYAPAK